MSERATKDDKTGFTVEQTSSKKTAFYIAAPAGYYRTSKGEIVSDGSKGGPEMTTKREESFVFRSYRASQLQAAKIAKANIREVKREVFLKWKGY